MLQCEKLKNIIIMLLYTFLAILYCDFIKRVKVFIIIMSFLINKKLRVYLKHIFYCIFIIFYVIHFYSQIEIKLQEIIYYSLLSKTLISIRLSFIISLEKLTIHYFIYFILFFYSLYLWIFPDYAADGYII